MANALQPKRVEASPWHNEGLVMGLPNTVPAAAPRAEQPQPAVPVPSVAPQAPSISDGHDVGRHPLRRLTAAYVPVMLLLIVVSWLPSTSSVLLVVIGFIATIGTVTFAIVGVRLARLAPSR
jgi:hypothetical protein